METLLFESIYNHKFNFNFTFSVYSNREKTISSLSEIERLLSFVLTHCSSHLIEEVLYQKLKIEQARQKLEIETSSISNEEELSSFFEFDKISLNEDRFSEKNSEVKRLVRLLFEAKKSKLKNVKSLIHTLNGIVKLDANLALAFLLEIQDSNLDIFESAYKFDSAVSYEFLLYLFSLNMVGKVHQKERFIMPQKFYYYFLKASTLIQLIETAEAEGACTGI